MSFVISGNVSKMYPAIVRARGFWSSQCLDTSLNLYVSTELYDPKHGCNGIQSVTIRVWNWNQNRTVIFSRTETKPKASQPP